MDASYLDNPEPPAASGNNEISLDDFQAADHKPDGGAQVAEPFERLAAIDRDIGDEGDNLVAETEAVIQMCKTKNLLPLCPTVTRNVAIISAEELVRSNQVFISDIGVTCKSVCKEGSRSAQQTVSEMEENPIASANDITAPVTLVASTSLVLEESVESPARVSEMEKRTQLIEIVYMDDNKILEVVR